MTVHLIKLCVGADSLADLRNWQLRVATERLADGGPGLPYHVTRMTPKRREDLLFGGSMYWVVKGVIQARQRVLDIDEVVGADGIKRCRLTFDEDLIETVRRRKKAFQGWRYLDPKDAPADKAGQTGAGAELPDALRRELVELGAW